MSRKRQPYYKIKAYLVENRIKHNDLASVLNTTANTISKKLNGFGADFTLSQAKMIHFKVGVPVSYFFEPDVPKEEHELQRRENG